TIQRPGEEDRLTKTLTREVIQIRSVPYSGMLTDEIGYIRLGQFTEKSSIDVKTAFKELKEKHSMKKLVLDLRGNPGGLLIEAVHIVNIFVDKGREIVSTKGKLEQWNNTYSAINPAIDTEIPVVVLVNRGSASASEIVSGAMQDLDRGVIIGERTFGKGLVQTTRKLSYNSQLKVTTAKYYIPSGRCIQALDYSNRNEDGSVGKVPDSLISEFKTSIGRAVFDGGGIEPDIKIKPEELGKISISLLNKNLIFDYVTDYCLKHDSVPSPGELDFTAEEYDDFKNFLKDKDYDYETFSEKKLKELTNIARREKYFDMAQHELEELKKTLAHDKDKDLQVFSDEIRQLLREEIASRYYYQAGRIEALLKNDKDVAKAVEVLKNTEIYSSVLDGTYKPEKVEDNDEDE
ncbi:MAG: peptidase S41, partial [Bacteroidetes bacterium]|nr:peptidase S41 [Bacteroidota bacterium]